MRQNGDWQQSSDSNFCPTVLTNEQQFESMMSILRKDLTKLCRNFGFNGFRFVVVVVLEWIRSVIFLKHSTGFRSKYFNSQKDKYYEKHNSPVGSLEL